jgi:hypothetical protein
MCTGHSLKLTLDGQRTDWALDLAVGMNTVIPYQQDELNVTKLLTAMLELVEANRLKKLIRHAIILGIEPRHQVGMLGEDNSRSIIGVHKNLPRFKPVGYEIHKLLENIMLKSNIIDSLTTTSR